jgi:hypothetical protein
MKLETLKDLTGLAFPPFASRRKHAPLQAHRELRSPGRMGRPFRHGLGKPLESPAHPGTVTARAFFNKPWVPRRRRAWAERYP